MKRHLKFTAIILLAAIALLTGCKKEKEDENHLTLAGNTRTGYEYNKVYTYNNLTYFTGLTCSGSYHRTQITFNLIPDASLYVDIQLPSNGIAGVPEGTFSLVATTCESGFRAFFEVYPTTKADYSLEISSGTVTVAKNGEEYIIDVNLIIAPASGGGTIKGKFSGPIEPVEM